MIGSAKLVLNIQGPQFQTLEEKREAMDISVVQSRKGKGSLETSLYKARH